jgi:hypothetical protein
MNRKPRGSATCHPNQPHYSKGFCKYCYTKQYKRPHRSVRSPAQCHPERKSYSGGFCYSCYFSKSNLEQSAKRPRAECHPEQPHYAKGFCRDCYKKKRYIESDQEQKRAKSTSAMWYADNKNRAKNSTLLYHYGITLDKYYMMKEQQNNVCAICKQPPTKKGLSVDHNHSTNVVRQLLCTHCNLLLGAARENQDILEGAILYLQRHDNLRAAA